MILKIDTSKREEFKDITNEIDEIVKNFNCNIKCTLFQKNTFHNIMFIFLASFQ
jgi:thiamine phosphate synthase YjbQ (UPF0047 family)